MGSLSIGQTEAQFSSKLTAGPEWITEDIGRNV